MKAKIKITCIILISIVVMWLILSFFINKLIISNYNKEIYNHNLVKSLYVLNINQPYIAYYNDANILYKKEKYSDSIIKYKKALKKNPPQDKVCDIRINLSLAMIKNIKLDSSKEDIYNDLEEAKQNLYENNCANSNDDSGYSKEAEQLEKEIIELQKQITNSNSNQSQEEQDESKEDYSNIEEKLKEQQQETNSSRQEYLNDTYSESAYINKGEIYKGKKW